MTDKINSSRFRAATLAALLARHYPDATPHRISLVVWQMQAAARSAVAFEKQQDAINKTLAELPTWHGSATVKLGGDPRGPCARLEIPGQPGDGFGDGFAIF
jgi:hypothetical protein